MKELLFDSPWWLPLLAAVVGVALAASGNRRQDKTLLRVGLGILLLGVALFLVSWFGETDREIALRRSRELIAAYNARDWETMRALLDPKTTLANYGNREMILAGARASVEPPLGVSDATITSIEAEQTQTVIAVTLTVLSTQERTMDRPITSTWRFEWVETGDGWQLLAIEPLALMGQDPNPIRQQLPRVAR